MCSTSEGASELVNHQKHPSEGKGGRTRHRCDVLLGAAGKRTIPAESVKEHGTRRCDPSKYGGIEELEQLPE